MFPTHISTVAAVLLLLTAMSSLPAGGPRRAPSPAELFSGKALNDMFRDISAVHDKGRRGPKVALDAAILKQINVAPPGGGNFALLRNEGKLTWPLALTEEPFRGDREKMQGLVLKALQALKQEKAVEKGILTDLKGAVLRLGEVLRKEVNDIPTGQYIEARRYLNDLGDAVTALSSTAAGKFVDGTFAAKGKTVEELVEHLRRQALAFSPAVGGQDAAYRALYQALAAYNAGLTSK